MTKKEMFVAISEVPAVAANAEMVGFLLHEIELVEKRNAKAQRDAIVEFLSANPQSPRAAVADAIGVTLHSATGLLTQLRKQGRVMREYKGKTPVYSLGTEPKDEGEGE